MNKLTQAQFSSLSADHIIGSEFSFVENRVKDCCEKDMNRDEVLDWAQNEILYKAYWFKYGIREAKKLYWEAYKEIYR